MTIASLLLFTVQNLALILGAAILTKTANKNSQIGSLKKILLIATFYFSEIIIIETVLGTFGALSSFNASLISCLLPILLAAIFYKHATKSQSEPGACAQKAKPAHRRCGTTSEALIRCTKGTKALFATIAIFTPISILLLIRIFNAMLQIPLEYDSVSYHLPFIAKWLQTSSLTTPYFTAFSSPIGYYPSNYELLDLWAALPFKNDFFFQLITFPLLAILAIAIYGICRNLQISRKISVLSTGLVFYMPIFLKQAGTPLVDLFFTLTFALGIYFLQEIIKNKNESLDCISFGLSLGLFVGTKYLGIPYAAILIILLLIFCRKPKALITILTGIILTGSFFYLRNWLTTGNPLFPVEISLFGQKIFEGYQGVNKFIDSSALIHHLNNWPEIKKFTSLLYQQVGPQIFIIFASLIFTFAILIYEIFRKHFRQLLPPFILLTTNLLYFFLYLKAPYTYQNLFENIRYAMPFFILGCINIAWVANYLKKLKYFFYFGVFAITSYSLTRLIHLQPAEIKLNLTYQLYLLLLSLAVFLLLYSFSPKNFKNKKLQITLSLISFTISLPLFYKIMIFTANEREILTTYFSEAEYAKDPRINNLIKANNWIEKNAPTSKIAYAGFNFHYHLFGRNLQRAVDYININDCQDCDYYDFRSTKDSIRSNPDYESWLENLAAKEKEYLVLDTKFTANVKPYEQEWATAHPEKFQQVFKEDNTYIYKIAR